MSKRNFRINPRDQFRDRSYSRGRFHGVENTENQMITIKSPRGKGTYCQKKVKCTALDKYSPTSCRLEASSRPSKRKEVTTHADTDPKTSEYAFFKKLKEDAGLQFHSHSLQKDSYLSKKPESNDCFRERSNNVTRSHKGFDSSTLIDNMSTVNSELFLSPSGEALKKSEQYPINSIQKPLQEYGGDTFPPPGNQYVHGETFSRKRQKLRQWVADTSCPDIEKLRSKGHDIVSMLLSRLFPKSKEENKYEYPNPGKVVTATRDDLLASRDSDIQFKEHHQILMRKLPGRESSLYSSDHSASPLFLRSDERIISYADYPIHNFNEFQPLYSTTEPECKFGETPSFSAKSDLSLGFLFNEHKHESFTLNHFNEPGKLGREPIPLLLDKDFDSPTDEMSSPVNYEIAKPDVALGFLNSIRNGEEQMLNNMLGEYRSCSASLFPNQPPDFYPTLESGLLRYQECGFRKYVSEDKEDMDADFNHTSLGLSYNKDYLKLLADYKNDTSCVQKRIYLSPYQHWFRTVSYDYQQHPDIEGWLSSPFDVFSGQRCLSLAGSNSDYQIPNYGILQSPQKGNMSTLFHGSRGDYKPDPDVGNHKETFFHFREDVLEVYNSSFFRVSMQSDNGCPSLLDGSDYISEHKMLL